jgi:2-dehydropantoate 2-reductase
MRIAVMAAGAVGGYFGGRMAAAGHDVTFIARGAHLDAIRQDGLRIESVLGDLHLKNVSVTDDPKQVGFVDVVLFTVKAWDIELAGEQSRPLVGSGTRVITLQNGVDSVERLAPILGDEAVVGGSTYLVTAIARPGVIRHTNQRATIRCGRLDRRPDTVLARYVEEMKTANIDITLMGRHVSRALEEIRTARRYIQHYRKHASARRRYSQRRGHAVLVQQADVRGHCGWPRGRRRVPAGLPGRTRSDCGGLSADHESLHGERS